MHQAAPGEVVLVFSLPGLTSESVPHASQDASRVPTPSVPSPLAMCTRVCSLPSWLAACAPCNAGKHGKTGRQGLALPFLPPPPSADRCAASTNHVPLLKDWRPALSACSRRLGHHHQAGALPQGVGVHERGAGHPGGRLAAAGQRQRRRVGRRRSASLHRRRAGRRELGAAGRVPFLPVCRRGLRHNIAPAVCRWARRHRGVAPPMHAPPTPHPTTLSPLPHPGRCRRSLPSWAASRRRA